MAITGSALLANIGSILKDPGKAVWDDALKTDFVNESLRLIALLRPDATATTESFNLVADTPKQSIPATGLRFLDVTRNIDGIPVRKISREELSDSVPSWTTEETASAIEHVMFDEENPKVFFVHPVPTEIFAIELVYSDLPAVFSSASTSLGVDDIYETPVKDFTLFRCLSMEGKGQDLAKAASHLSAFYTALGVKAQSDSILKQVQDIK